MINIENLELAFFVSLGLNIIAIVKILKDRKKYPRYKINKLGLPIIINYPPMPKPYQKPPQKINKYMADRLKENGYAAKRPENKRLPSSPPWSPGPPLPQKPISRQEVIITFLLDKNHGGKDNGKKK